MLSLAHISHTIGPRRILEDVCWEIGAGEFACLAGVSGSGKSTLLRLIAGLETVQEGAVVLRGQPVASPDTHMPPEQRGVGIVFQHPSLFPHLSVLENVMFGLAGLTKKQARETARHFLHQVRFSGREDAYPHQLSGGEHQRVALARALAPEPSILLLDEPFANLDARLRHTIRETTHAFLKERGTTTIMVTHDPQEALMLADSICLLGEQGQVLQSGPPERLYTQPADAHAACFFGPVNLIEGHVEHGAFICALGRLPLPAGTRDSVTTLILRPEALVIGDTAPGIEAVIERITYCGAYRLLGVKTGDLSLTVFQSGPSGPASGETLRLGILPGDLHFI